MSVRSDSTSSAPSKVNLMRGRRARLLRAREGDAPEDIAGTGPADVAPGCARVEPQQRFLAYAAHELRGTIALQRTLAEVALADPGADTASLREMGERVVAACEGQERLIAALLTLTRNDCGRLRREPVDVAEIVADIVETIDYHGLQSSAELAPARTAGDPQLVGRLVANLVANAVRHNVPGGRLEVATYTAVGRAVFTIENTGPVIAADELTRLFQPFQRISSLPDRPADGIGLGLALVQAIANAHRATVCAQPLTGGGLAIQVAFPALD